MMYICVVVLLYENICNIRASINYPSFDHVRIIITIKLYSNPPTNMGFLKACFKLLIKSLILFRTAFI